ncbi:zinc protease PQQL-like [Magnolia sinica]|uniref:zinc protease PQQL-like n=1 Tax=Magnolia sinica TaxID=86752 RepID=UPI002658326F|nr:zinc protease PQQL-like [Magnolia sinica]
MLKYAERIPIGLEKVIRTVSSEMVKQFYNRWYHLHFMAVVAVGDFTDTQSVVELIRTHFGKKFQSPPRHLYQNFLFHLMVNHAFHLLLNLKLVESVL